MIDPFSDPADTREEILGAAYRALCAHGYSSLTIQRIGDEFEKSPSLLYHHYDGKDDLLVDLLGFLLDGFEDALSEGTCSGTDGPPEAIDDGTRSATGTRPDDEASTAMTFEASPRERIEGYVVAMSDPGALEEEDRAPDDGFLRAVVELRAQAAHDGAYREHFDRSDRVFQRYLERAVREAAMEMRGTDSGPNEASDFGVSEDEPTAEPVSAREVAATVQTLATGGMLRWATTTDREWIGDSLAGLGRYLDAMLPCVRTEN